MNLSAIQQQNICWTNETAHENDLHIDGYIERTDVVADSIVA